MTMPNPGGVVLDKCEGDGCKCPPGMVGVQPFCQPVMTMPNPGGIVLDKCEGDGCKCPPGMVGVQPFCRQPDSSIPIEKRDTCVDGTTKKESCNSCTCMNGNWACTLMACPEDMFPRPPVNARCIDGTTKME